MNRSVPLVLVLALVVFPFFLPSVLRAQTGDDRVPAIVKTGLKVSIVDEQGRQINGRVDGISPGVIRLSRRGAIEDIPLDRVVRIDEPDGLRNGALAGLGVGLSLGLLGAATQPRGAEAKWVLASVLSNSVACTLLGTGIDAVFNNRRTLYERGGRRQTRLSPIVGRGARGAAVSWTW